MDSKKLFMQMSIIIWWWAVLEKWIFENFHESKFYSSNSENLPAVTPDLSEMVLKPDQTVNLMWDSEKFISPHSELSWEMELECNDFVSSYSYMADTGSQKPIYSVQNYAKPINEAGSSINKNYLS